MEALVGPAALPGALREIPALRAWSIPAGAPAAAVAGQKREDRISTGEPEAREPAGECMYFGWGKWRFIF